MLALAAQLVTSTSAFQLVQREVSVSWLLLGFPPQRPSWQRFEPHVDAMRCEVCPSAEADCRRTPGWSGSTSAAARWTLSNTTGYGGGTQSK